MTQKFQPGDVVKMNSGGPAMTVESIENGNVHCSWFDGSTSCEKTLKEELLKKDEPTTSVGNFELLR